MRLCKSTLTTKLILLVLMIFAITTIVSLQPKIDAYGQTGAALSDEIFRLEQENLAIKDDIRSLGSDASVVEIAHERLNLVFEDEVIFIDND